jgi:hypothetical protein
MWMVSVLHRTDNGLGTEEPGAPAVAANPWHMGDATRELMENKSWCTLIQRVAPNLEEYDQAVINAGTDYLNSA